MTMLQNPASKYRAFPPIDLPDRQWPSKIIAKAPIWMSTDLRDGNQSLFEPMNRDRKMQFYKMLVEIGFKEIEVGFPSASQTDFDFVRELIEGGHIPEDVTIEVLTQAREDLIERTIESCRGARRAIIHLYNAVAPNFRRIVFNTDVAGVKQIAVKAATHIKKTTALYPETEWVYQYSPEVFSTSELEVVKEVSEAVLDVFQPTPQRKLILNLPATVECATPNVYADQIEWMCRNLKNRESVIISVHPHNDRGTGVAAAELAVMAGADRVEGCLFGNGERTGNVDLVTLALNLYTQGVNPGLDFSRINDIARTVEECNQLPIHPRHPYVGDLVFTAFSGSHQDAIKKGFAAQKADATWDVPYMPIDPADLGRTYDSVIRVNSQSGKGGIAYLLESVYGLVMPRRLQVEFSGAVQKVTDETGQEVTAQQLWTLFQQQYVGAKAPFAYKSHSLSDRGDEQHIVFNATLDGRDMRFEGSGNGPLDALVNAVGLPITLHHYEERSLGQGANANAVAYAEVARTDTVGSTFGVGVHANILTASIQAVISGVNRLYERADEQDRATFFQRVKEAQAA